MKLIRKSSACRKHGCSCPVQSAQRIGVLAHTVPDGGRLSRKQFEFVGVGPVAGSTASKQPEVEQPRITRGSITAAWWVVLATGDWLELS